MKNSLKISLLAIALVATAFGSSLIGNAAWPFVVDFECNGQKNTTYIRPSSEDDIKQLAQEAANVKCGTSAKVLKIHQAITGKVEFDVNQK